MKPAIREITKWVTSDGREFDRKDLATAHEGQQAFIRAGLDTWDRVAIGTPVAGDQFLREMFTQVLGEMFKGPFFHIPASKEGRP